ncbi:glucose 1-dehydrogenase [Tardiphaga sp. OK245]|uniref:SDR family NAD(P)-dependent oxidoreductase n=1 Tax=Tardiphaga sp. OK245 TaxID=1855306 RepID=UPI000B821B39|nr:glucose 1-dehydrogenase [Tardiphaga sp. OK245]
MNTLSISSARVVPALNDRIAIVTGAASGIGHAQARLYAAAGAQVVAVDRSSDALLELVSTIRGDGDKAVSITADLTSTSDIARLVKETTDQFGRIDILANTAGLHDGYVRSLETSDELWDRLFDVNVKAVFRLTNAVLPGMLERGHGVIVNIASVASFVAGGGGPAYTASKHAIMGYTRQLAHEYGRKGIRANAVCPGMVETGMTREVLSDSTSRFVKAVNAVPAGRFAQPEDIADVALFLATDAARFMHGAGVMVDGGLTVR